jgi:AmmeMemoRadiSam system protein A
MKDTKQSQYDFSKEQGRALVALARKTIVERLGQKNAESEIPETDINDSIFQANCGAFVTLKKKGQLRGCIGSLHSDEPILEGVKHNAINAAFRDPRFPPLTADEIRDVDIEVSILTEPQPLEYKDSTDLISKLRVNVDGVIITKGLARATFLPQVWEQLADPVEFLSHLCMKAGLKPDAWQKNDLEVLTYQARYFEEH